MESQCSRLCDLMDEALGAISTLDGILEQDLAYIRDLRMTELYESNKRKEGLENLLRQVEERWKEVADSIGSDLGLPSEKRTLSDVAKRVNSPWHEALTERRDRLNIAMRALREKGQANINLLKHSLIRINESLSLIGHFTNPGAIYGSGGKLDPPGGSGSLLSERA